MASQIIIMKKKPSLRAEKNSKKDSLHLRALAEKITKVPNSINIPEQYRDFFAKFKLTEEKK